MKPRWISLLGIAAVPVVLGAVLYSVVGASHRGTPSAPATLRFTSQDESLTAELLPLHGEEPLRPAFHVRDSELLTVPSGSYRLRLAAPNRLSETLLVDASPGPAESLPVKLEDALLWPPLPLPHGGELVEIDGRTDVLQFTKTGVRRLHGATTKTLWEVELDNAVLLNHARVRWSDFLSETDDTLSHLAHTAVDLDGDGTRDLLWLSRSTPALFAQSGYDGELLWAYRGGEEGQVDGEPLVFDRGGKPAFLVKFRMGERCWLEAVSGDKGERLWRTELDAAKKEACFIFTCARRGGKTIVSIIAGGALLELDAVTGHQQGEPLMLERSSNEPLVHAQFVDDMLLLRRGAGDSTLTALSLTTRETLWERRLANAKPQDRPLIQREDDHTLTVLVENGSTENQCVLEALDGRTGQTRWIRRFPIQGPNQRANVVFGPDLDADGRHEVFVATVALPHHHNGEPQVYLFLDALAGKDGSTRWTTKLRRPFQSLGTFSLLENQLVGLSWWQTGADGWPQLLVAVAPSGSGGESLTYVVSAGSGRVANVLHQTGWPNHGTADFDGDGVPDSYWFEKADSGRLLHTVRGGLPEAWRRPGNWQPVGEVDGATAFAHTPTNQAGAAVISGRDGQLLFETEWPGAAYLASLAVPPGDLADEGVGAIVASGGDRFVALSGKTGKTLWTAPLPEKDTSLRALHLLGCDGARGRGDPTVLMHVRTVSVDAKPDHHWLVALAGKDGTTRWQHDLGTLSQSSVGVEPLVTLADINFDGYPDMLTWSLGGDGHWELRAINGRNGKTLWARRFSFDVRTCPVETLPAVGLTNLGELVGPSVVIQDEVKEDGTTFVEVVALDSTTGQARWTWRSAAGATLHKGQMPVTLILDGRTPSICLLTATGPKSAQLVFLDEYGKQRKQIPLEDASATRLWPARLNSYQTMGLACSSVEGGGLLNLVRVLGSGEKALWQWRPDHLYESAEIVDVGSAYANGPATLIVRIGGWYHGVSALNGQLEWRTQERPALVSACSNGESPYLVMRTPTATICRIATRTPEKETLFLNTAAPTRQERFAEIVARYYLDWASVMTLGALLVTALVNRRWLFAVLVAAAPATGYAALLGVLRDTTAAEPDPRLLAEHVTAGTGGQTATLGVALLLAGLLVWGLARLLRHLGPRFLARMRPGRGW